MSQDLEDGGAPPDVPTDQTMPNQQGGTSSASAELTAAIAPAGPADGEPAPAAGRRSGQRPMTAKSSYNRLAYVRQD